MRCTFDDGIRVSFCGPLRIEKEGEINVSLDRWEIPDDIQGELIEAALHGNCNEMRNAAREVTDTFGKNVPEGFFDSCQYSEYFEQ